MTTEKQILQDTYDILEARGWCQGEMQKPDGRVCLEGAFRVAVGVDLYDNAERCVAQPEVVAAWAAICASVLNESGESGGSPYIIPWIWNDRPERTVEDVKLMLKKAIGS